LKTSTFVRQEIPAFTLELLLKALVGHLGVGDTDLPF
jgi:hypothetical protein